MADVAGIMKGLYILGQVQVKQRPAIVQRSLTQAQRRAIEK